MVNVTVLQCNWLQNTENNLLIQVDSQWYGIVSVQLRLSYNSYDNLELFRLYGQCYGVTQ